MKLKLPEQTAESQPKVVKKRRYKFAATERHLEIANEICRSFSFTGADDRETTIGREHCENASETILKLKSEILKLYPRTHTVKLRKNEKGWRYNLTVLRQLLTYHKMKILSTRTFEWNKETKKTTPVYSYKIVS